MDHLLLLDIRKQLWFYEAFALSGI